MLIVQAMRPDRLQSAMSLFASRALGKVHSHSNQFFSVSLFAPLYIMLTCIYARLGWSLRVDADFLKVFFLVGYAVLKDFSFLFGAKFSGRKFCWWRHDNWPIGQSVIFHAASDTAYVNHSFPAWISNVIPIHSGETDFVARSVAAWPHAFKLTLDLAWL